jgi:hypothetical protein
VSRVDQPRVTVLMPVYNGALYLSEAVQSILQQSFSDFEFLIIDDGSNDDSVKIIHQFCDSRIRLVHNKVNMGLIASLNRGLGLARGEYVARMDADDISRPYRLKSQVRFMDSNQHIGVCGSWIQLFPKAKSKVWKFPEKSDEIRCWQFHAVGVAHPAVMMRRQLFTDLGLLYDPAYPHVEDYELWSRAIHYMDFANIQKVLLDYRISSGQICAKHGSEQLLLLASLRRQQVIKLGIDPTQEEQQLHEAIMNNTMPLDADYLDKAEQWLLRLEMANRLTCIYPGECFSKRLLEIWYAICSSLADSSRCSCKRCILSPLWATANVSAWQRVRALGAWMAGTRS